MKYILTLLIFITSSCATLNKEDCTKMNWTQRGHQDASYGEIIQYSKYQEQCREFGITVPKNDYLTGYKEGLKVYCTYQNGLALGQRGAEPFTACSAVASNFYRGYEKGFALYEHEQERARREKEKENAINEILRRYDSKQCTSDFDCRKEGTCRLNKCEHNGKQCTFNNDCQIQGDCKTESQYLSSINEWVKVRVCDY